MKFVRSRVPGSAATNESRQKVHHVQISLIALPWSMQLLLGPLVDLNSTNGTVVNGRPVRRHRLSEGDRIEAGETTIEFHGA